VNYDCVKAQLIDEFGTCVEVRRLPYASEEATRALQPKEAPLIVCLSRVWLRSLALGNYEAAFRENDIDETCRA